MFQPKSRSTIWGFYAKRDIDGSDALLAEWLALQARNVALGSVINLHIMKIKNRSPPTRCCTESCQLSPNILAEVRNFFYISSDSNICKFLVNDTYNRILNVEMNRLICSSFSPFSGGNKFRAVSFSGSLSEWAWQPQSLCRTSELQKNLSININEKDSDWKYLGLSNLTYKS